MAPTRREFLRQVGIFFAAWLASGCQPTAVSPSPKSDPQPLPVMTCYKPAITEPPSIPTPLAHDPHWKILRAIWLELKNPKLYIYDETDFSRRLREQHTEAIAILVEAGLLDSLVAADIQVAFEEAITHIRRQLATCYRGELIQLEAYTPRQDMLTQAEALTEMAQRSALDPETVERASAALARDMTWLTQFQAGQEPADWKEIQATPTEIKAARILAELLATAD